MRTPQLNRRMTLETPVRSADDAGGYVESWTPLGTLWAEVTPRTGREAATGGAPVSRVGVRIVLRAAPVGDPSRPLPQQRLREGTRVFTLDAVTEWDRAGRYLECFATEEVVA